jgi:preprotein translocase subunit YajC
MGAIATAAAATSSGSNPTFLILIVVIFVVFYFLMIRPQRQRQQRIAQQQGSVQPGARVRTTAGMYGTVVAVDGDDVVLELAPGVEVRFMKRAIMDVVTEGEPAEEEDTSAEEDSESEDSSEPSSGWADEPSDQEDHTSGKRD